MREETGNAPEAAQSVTDDSRHPLRRLSLPEVLKRHAVLVLTAALFMGGVYALYRLLAPLDMKVVLGQIRHVPPQVVAGALAATVAGYVALIGYDWSALRYIGKKVPLGATALGSFLGYSMGNTIGLSAVSGGAVRYRIYSALGLDAYDVAAISTFGAVSYGVGATLIGLVALAVDPVSLEGLTALSTLTLQSLAWSGVAVIAGVLIWITQRGGAIRVGRFSMRAPTAGETLRQLCITFTDVAMAALVLHLLLPTGSIPYVNVLAVLAVATLVGVASHVPGGIGVFESVVLAALPSSVPVNDAVTALLLFRLMYFLLPFVVALAVLSLTEIWGGAAQRLPGVAGLAPVVRAGRSLIPTAMGVLVLLSGLYMMFAGILPNPRFSPEEIETFLPLALVAGGPMLSSVLGSFMVVLSISIFRRSRMAFWLVLAVLVYGAGLAVFRSGDYDRVIGLAGLAAILLPCRHEFYRKARLSQGLLSAQWIVFTAAIIASLALTWSLVHEGRAPRDMMWWQVMGDAPAVAAWRVVFTGAVLLSAVLLYAALRAARTVTRLPDTAELDAAQALIAAHGRGADMIGVTGDKMLMFGPAGKSVLSYAVKGTSWIAMGAPVGEARDAEDLAWAFHDAARAAGARPVFYEADAGFTEQAIDMGLTLHKMGEEAVVALPGFSLEGPARKKLRTTHARAGRDGLLLELSTPPHSDALIAGLRAISDDWLGQHAAREKQFSVGRFDPAWLGRTRIALVRHNGVVCAFANLMEARQGCAVDLMRYRQGAPSGTMEFLFTELMLQLKAEGCAQFSLGMVPFAGLPGRSGATLWARFGNLVYSRGEKLYNFDGLYRFKSKFDPDWQPRYFCCRSALPPVGPLADAARLIAGSARGIVGK
ncbi:bifunctional lysylphosphatidylglycerol flippase/synthetase MprF [Pseudooceanicola sediminis]|uniref:Phosphatidylglycerol lysyltransferase n=1 Tax=Pseudooceanicola sediminis TaxID=2211117 RepID=A0A399IVG5_9RHOB|nr:bifunctional lysylphosphatidylglycerol flippase/synthetase MprF [Pseudooceanicola sediminis]KAA2314915.1 bifunctional lysylphosphatidylglycerol flippase/synthetase MprF [Puniceibacterium sp. HSS470]RII36940.1 bifunctional lysylphosphatidylglycerol flippase/synthetase MprF [Pseudooceanicola sediminis]|tara:strand:- start:11012 stop:13648 length:2637 start_codon:yes stop_codon:yes gene_type:complete